MSQLFNEALEHYKSQRFEQSEILLRQLKSENPDDLPAISLLATVILQSIGPTTEAESLMQTALRIEPDNVDLVNNLGSLYWAQSRYDSALECFENALRLNPDHVDAWHNLGKTLSNLDQADEAEQAFKRALYLDPVRPDICNSYALFLHGQGQPSKAIEVLQYSIQHKSDFSRTYGNLGIIFQSQGRYDDAAQAYLEAIKHNPRNSNFFNNLGQVYFIQGKYHDAIVSYRKAIVINPKSALAFNNLGLVFRELEQNENAIASFERAKEVDPAMNEASFNLGVTYYAEGRYLDAREQLEPVVENRPGWAAALYNLANAYAKLDLTDLAIARYSETIECGPSYSLAAAYCFRGHLKANLLKWEAAIGDFDLALHETPDYATARFFRAFCNLKLGRLESGWRDYEWRFAANSSTGNVLAGTCWSQPEWDGKPFPDKVLLVHHEQGLGDAIHFSRYLPIVKEMGGDVILRCGPPLFRLFESISAIGGIYNRREESSLDDVHFDYQIPLVTLPYLFNTRIETIPNPGPYLNFDNTLVEKWAARIETSDFKVGLVWEGNPDQGDNDNRSCKLEDYGPLTEVPGITFFSLQVGEAGEQEETPPVGMTLVNFANELTDMADTAGLIRNLDLIITVDTSVAHLAGALGHPVWVVLWTNCCWRYLLDRDDSPWYSSMRLFRQNETGNWKTVIEQVATELRSHLDSIPVRGR